MTFKTVVRSLGGAFLYFGIYILWQLVVMFCAAFGIGLGLSFNMSTQMGSEMAENGDVAEVLEKLLELLQYYTVHLTALAGILSIVTYFVIFKVRKKSFFGEVGLYGMPIYHGAFMLVLGMALNLATVFILSVIPFPQSWWEQYNAQASAMTDTDLWATVLLSVIIAPILEEIVFRGLVYTRLKRCMPMFAAMIICAWLFGVMHGALIWFIYASVFGFLLCFMYEKYKTLLAPLLVHFGFNLCGSLTSEAETLPGYICAAALLLSVGIIVFVQVTSKNKLEFTMPRANNLPSSSDGGEN